MQHCMGFGTSAAGGAGAESFVELWNAAANSVMLRVTRVVINTKDTVVKVKYHTAKQGSTALTIGNKSLGGSTPAALLYGNNAASVSGTQVGSLICTVDADRELDLSGDPIVVFPGKALIFENTDAVEAITTFEIHWDEVPFPGVV
ncbi:MAG: hypothetical protein KAV87_50135 [Desulfobacteraceae bacterium]|nr:hypothetical protein [Desulfobacteraceae bacterium]